MSTAEYFEQSLRLGDRADQLGYHSVKTVEHYFSEREALAVKLVMAKVIAPRSDMGEWISEALRS